MTTVAEQNIKEATHASDRCMFSIPTGEKTSRPPNEPPPEEDGGTALAKSPSTPPQNGPSTTSVATPNPKKTSKTNDFTSQVTCYAYRYYNSNFGRWINRDPIGEMGGLNLYGFVKNNPVTGIDFLGKQMKNYITESAVVQGVKNWEHDHILRKMEIEHGRKATGLTKALWPERRNVIKCDGCILKIIESKLIIEIQVLEIYLTGSLKDHREGKYNLTTREHERRHEYHHQISWNAAAAAINPHHNKDFKTEICCMRWAGFFKTLYSTYELLAILKDETFDCEEYGRCEGIGAAKASMLRYASELQIPNCDAT